MAEFVVDVGGILREVAELIDGEEMGRDSRHMESF
jgi:hypothetical protein